MKTGAFLARYEANKSLLSSVVEQQDKGLGTNLPVVYVPRDMTTSRCMITERHRIKSASFKCGHICPRNKGLLFPYT